MNDDLRDRVIKAIYENCNLTEHRCGELADAVILELGLREEEDGTGDFGSHTRYVTKWSDE
jgi:hypothetical protein